MHEQIKISNKFIEHWFDEFGFELYQIDNDLMIIEYLKPSISTDWYIKIDCDGYLRPENEQIFITANQFHLTLIKYRKNRLLQTMDAFTLIERIPFTTSDDDLVFIKKIITKLAKEKN